MLIKLMRGVLLLSAIAFIACSKPEPLTEAKAKDIVSAWIFKREPVYAEVPQRVDHRVRDRRRRAHRRAFPDALRA